MLKSKPEVKLAPFTMMFAEGYTFSCMSLFREQASDMRVIDDKNSPSFIWKEPFAMLIKLSKIQLGWG